MKLGYPETGVGSFRLPLHWSQPSQGKRRRKLKVSFGSSDHGGERPVLSFTADSYGHEARPHQRPQYGSLISLST